MRAMERAAVAAAVAGILLAGCSDPEPEVVYKDVPADAPEALEVPDGLGQDPTAMVEFFVTSVSDVDPATHTGTTRINQMKNELVIHPAAEGCSQGPFSDAEVDALREEGATLHLKDMQDVTDDPVDEPTTFARAYMFNVSAVDAEGNPSGESLQGGEEEITAYIIAERNSDADPFMITECSFQATDHGEQVE